MHGQYLSIAKEGRKNALAGLAGKPLRAAGVLVGYGWDST